MKKKLLNLGLMLILIVGIVFLSGCVQEENSAEVPIDENYDPYTFEYNIPLTKL